MLSLSVDANDILEYLPSFSLRYFPGRAGKKKSKQAAEYYEKAIDVGKTTVTPPDER